MMKKKTLIYYVAPVVGTVVVGPFYPGLYECVSNELCEARAAVLPDDAPSQHDPIGPYTPTVTSSSAKGMTGPAAPSSGSLKVTLS